MIELHYKGEVHILRNEYEDIIADNGKLLDVLKAIYRNSMSQLVKPVMSFEEWLCKYYKESKP